MLLLSFLSPKRATTTRQEQLFSYETDSGVASSGHREGTHGHQASGQPAAGTLGLEEVSGGPGQEMTCLGESRKF